jgi:glutamate-1-semialdehyde 2,1-aminomutase/spore coat polysaccharide biosynthesis protein SpsF
MTLTFTYNDPKSLEKLFAEHPGQIAAVILEPMGVVFPKDDFLKKVATITRKEGAVLIFDEMLTGFRIARGGAQEYFGVTPDLACFGKAMANGYPISAVCGNRELMKLFDEVFFSFTFGGETVSLAAAKVTLEVFRTQKVIEHYNEMGQQLRDGYSVLAREYGLSQVTDCVGYYPRTLISWKSDTGTESLERKSLFQQECAKRGVLFAGAQNICLSHTQEDIHQTLRTYRAALEVMKEAVRSGDTARWLEGPPVQPVFRKP